MGGRQRLQAIDLMIDNEQVILMTMRLYGDGRQRRAYLPR